MKPKEEELNAYHMKNEALKHKSRKKRKTQEGDLATLREDKIVDQLGEEIGVSPRQIMRFIRLTKLIPELLELLDKGDISFNPAVEFSFLKEEEQRWVLDGMDYTQSKPSLSQAKRFKMLSQEEKLTADLIIDILYEVKKGEFHRVTFKNEQMYQYFPKEYSPAKIKEEILKLLDQVYGRKRG